MIIDPTGLFEDTWVFDESTGNLLWVDGTKYFDANGNEVDRIVSNNGDGTYIDVNPKVIDKMRINTVQVTYETQSGLKHVKPYDVSLYSFDNEAESKEFFEYASVQTSVEFNNIHAKSKFNEHYYFVTTSGDKRSSAGIGYVSDKLRFDIIYGHISHPTGEALGQIDIDGIRKLKNVGNRNSNYRFYQVPTGKYSDQFNAYTRL